MLTPRSTSGCNGAQQPDAVEAFLLAVLTLIVFKLADVVGTPSSRPPSLALAQAGPSLVSGAVSPRRWQKPLPGSDHIIALTGADLQFSTHLLEIVPRCFANTLARDT